MIERLPSSKRQLSATDDFDGAVAYGCGMAYRNMEFPSVQRLHSRFGAHRNSVDRVFRHRRIRRAVPRRRRLCLSRNHSAGRNASSRKLAIFRLQRRGRRVHRALPRATFVLCRRAPIDVALSIHRTSFKPPPRLSDRRRRPRPHGRAIDRLSDHWREVLPPARVHEIRYETLVADPERSIPALLAACGLPWDGRCLHPERNPRLVRTRASGR